MASKRKKRRQRERAAQKVRDFNMAEKITTSPANDMYEVALQLHARSPIYVFKVKEHDEKELVPFILRMYGVKNESDLNVLDIHQWMDDGTVQIIRESKDWPRGVQTIKKGGFCQRGGGVPKPTAAAEIVIPPTYGAKKETVKVTAPVKAEVPDTGEQRIPINRNKYNEAA